MQTIFTIELTEDLKAREYRIRYYLRQTLNTVIVYLQKFRDNQHNRELENMFVKHYAPNHMPDPKREWSLKENNSELHYGICSKVYQFIYTLVFNYMPIMRILAKEVLQISRSKGCSYTKCLCPKKKESNATGNLRNKFKS